MSDNCGCAATSCCAGDISTNPDSISNINKNVSWITGSISTSAGEIPVISTKISREDRINTIKLRWGIGRLGANVWPGLYAVGSPNADSEVLVTANYKMTFDQVRKQLDGLDVWLLVLDTKGINVWCAAGKGTFGTEEIIGRVKDVQLDQIVNHKKLILPQLGAPGVAAHEVKKESGFRVVYGPVRIDEIKKFLQEGKATPEMRRVRFPFKDRAVLVPMELIPALKFIPIFLVWAVAVQLVRDGRLSLSLGVEILPYMAALLTGTVLFQLILPWVPFRSFVIGGWILGILTVVATVMGMQMNPLLIIAHVLLLPPVTAYLAENFTGATTFTSLSGVQKELRLGIPVMIFSVLSGMVLQIFESLKG